jgi:hypothetical protein
MYCSYVDLVLDGGFAFALQAEAAVQVDNAVPVYTVVQHTESAVDHCTWLQRN